MLWKLFVIGRKVREARRDPAGFAGEEVADLALGVFLVPLIIAALGVVLFFILGFTGLLWGPFFFFKVLFIISLVIWLIFFGIYMKAVRFVRRKVAEGTRLGINEVTRKQL